MLIDTKEREKDEWMDHDDFSDIDDEDRAPKLEGSNVLSVGTPAGAVKDERRKRVMCHFEEHLHF